MDQNLSERSGNSVAVTGFAYEVPAASLSHDADPGPFLRVRKTVKFMSKQDRLAMVAAASAVRSAGLTPGLLATETTISMCVGPIPFQKDEALQVAEHSGDCNGFSMERFCGNAYEEVNPMLLFACLPNMPAYHISANLGIRGGYYLSYPSCAECYGALRNAVDTLAAGTARAVLFGGVADQDNFLVRNHHIKTGQSLPAPDGACFLVLETLGHARARNAQVLAILNGMRISEYTGAGTKSDFHFGAVELPLAVAKFAEGQTTAFTHRFQTNGRQFESEWVRNCKESNRAFGSIAQESRPSAGLPVSLITDKPECPADFRSGAKLRRVVVTGMGVVTPLGNTLEEFRQGLLAGRPGISAIKVFDPVTLPSRIAGQCSLDNFRFKDRKIDFAIHAAQSAVGHADAAGVPIGQFYPPDRRGVSMGVGLELFNMADLVSFARADASGVAAAGAGDISFLQTPGDLSASEVAKVAGSELPPAIHVSACAAGTDAIGDAFLAIANGHAGMMLAGGTDSMINPLGLAGFCKLNALSTNNADPLKASRPFDRNRDGFVLGEGAAVLVLENREDALKRGAVIYAEIAGYGNSMDAHSISEPDPEGRGAALAMRKALAMAGLAGEEIAYINAHGTSTPKNDPAETKAIKAVFGERAYRIPVSSTKSMIGHLISAAGAAEAVASILCANAGMVHPTANLEHADPECDLDYVANTARSADIGYFMSNSFAFGGMNASLVFRNGGGRC